jgi:anti-sigma regulatory factor (Ser/Thr protein kinase)
MTSARRFDGLPDSVPAARRFTRDALRDQSSAVVDAAELMVSELATNCVQHARSDFEITIHARDEVRVEVRDTDQRGRPQVQSPPPEAPSGRGLRIVQEISDEWGIVKYDDGKTVWFVLNPPAGRSREQSTARSAPGAPDESQPVQGKHARPGRRLLRHFRRGPRGCHPRARLMLGNCRLLRDRVSTPTPVKAAWASTGVNVSACPR